MPKSNRRSYVDLSEAVRTLNQSQDSKTGLANDIAASLDGEPDFSVERFLAHATSEDEDAKWAFNESIGAGPGTEGYID
jgi:hypothetical protein